MGVEYIGINDYAIIAELNDTEERFSTSISNNLKL